MSQVSFFQQLHFSDYTLATALQGLHFGNCGSGDVWIAAIAHLEQSSP
ncbi:MAG: hypothetical protein KME27_06960 [Lyngbya sp. HA4199-MV5]|nr:hypothetical protein [Lyngbya sp. HA4199-MV5]